MSTSEIRIAPSGRRPSPRAIASKTVWYVAATLIAITTVGPFLWTLSTSLKPASEALTQYLRLVPSSPTLENYVSVFTTAPFAKYMANSFLLAGVGVFTNVFFGGLGGYALAKLRFRGRNLVFWSFLSSMMIPAIVTMVPTFLVLRRFPLAGGNNLLGQGGTGFLNSYWAVILPGAAGAFAVFYMKQAFESLPWELGDAARLDGAGEFRIFWQVYLPLAKPSIAILAVMTFQAGWNAFLWPLIVLNDPSMYTVQVGLSSFVSEHQTDYGPLMAGTILATVPVLFLFAFAQKWIVQGDTHTSLK